MDTSKELYAGHDLEMIRKAVEIQALWNHQCGDWAWGKDDDRLMLLINSNKDRTDSTFVYVAFPDAYSPNHDTKLKDLLFWLPRQDQLQKMLPNHLRSDGYCMNLIYMANDFFKRELLLFNQCNSMEQVWLMIVMNVNFNKAWNGKDWVKS